MCSYDNIECIPGTLAHARGDNQVEDRTEHGDQPNGDKDDFTGTEACVDPAACLVEELDEPVVWLLDALHVKLRVDDLVPYVGYPGAGHQTQQHRVDHHVEDP